MENSAINLMSPYAFPHRARFPDRDKSFLCRVFFIVSRLYAAYNRNLIPAAVFITGILKRQKKGVSANTANLVGIRIKKTSLFA